ncbi:cytochrome P450 [Karstenula rhodostoma CBS 690.94]|uniref:Cytochrome P450 n=1 Tax=Karstenula rhodostoma CBS 690.94 TaxID=1392251 RepID=A0A9P4PS84_9PLEO|nr:cytochrome P450 [Karstenula rhodostoma CBS 690.94]
MFSSSNVGLAVVTLILGTFGLVVFKGLYNYWFHPLAKFPGPWYAAISNFSYCLSFLGGRHPYNILELHKKYGPVVRIAPNELSFNSAQSWKDIYDFNGPGKRALIKSNFYEGGTFADQCGSIVSERDPDKHGRMRRFLSNAFSQRSLIEQESIISVVVDGFVDKMVVSAKKGAVIDLTEWFNMATFDIIGELAFGESFRGIETGDVHPWIARITGAMKQGALADTFKRFPMAAKVAMLFLSKAIDSIKLDCKLNEVYALDLVKERASRQSDRKDFLTRILEQRDDTISDVQIAAHSADFVTAGSETTATALSCITYYLSKNKTVLEKLQQEIRTSFDSYDAIDSASTASLKYLNAVCQEGMRIYAPLPFALPRVVSDQGNVVDGHFLPPGVIVSTNPIAASLDPANFKDPLDFIPERWIEHNGHDVYEASQPFSTGPRGCLGRSLGWMEMRTILAKVHYTFDLVLADPSLDWHEESRMCTLWQKPALPMRIQLRAGQS